MEQKRKKGREKIESRGGQKQDFPLLCGKKRTEMEGKEKNLWHKTKDRARERKWDKSNGDSKKFHLVAN